MQDITNPISLPSFYFGYDVHFLFDTMQYFFIFHTIAHADRWQVNIFILQNHKIFGANGPIIQA
jgi:hypothetical protein